MNRSRRLEPVVEVAERREEEEARKLGEANRQLAASEARRVELEDYRRQYREQFLSVGNVGFGASQLKDYQIFLARLDQAVVQAHAQVEAARAACEQQRLVWLATRTRCLALDKVSERYAAEARRVAERREQRSTDEHAQQMEARRARSASEES